MKSFSCRLVKSNHHGLSFIALLMLASILAGCGEKDDKTKATQVAAKVNSEEITVSQVNNALSTVQATPGKTAEMAKQEVLGNLIVQNLAVQQAIKMKLDRNPAVMQAIENSKNMILARAYMDPIVSGIAKPTAEDIHKFYVDHPELFSDRHIFSMRELEIESRPEVMATVQDMINKGQNQDAIAAWAKEKNIPTNIQAGVKAAEQLPLEMLTKIAKIPVGKMLVIEMRKSISLVQIVSSKAEPVTESTATNAIQEYLNNTRKKETLENEIKSLKAAAKIEYFGDFQPAAKPAADAKPASSESSVKATEETKASDMVKGVTGLK